MSQRERRPAHDGDWNYEIQRQVVSIDACSEVLGVHTEVDDRDARDYNEVDESECGCNPRADEDPAWPPRWAFIAAHEDQVKDRQVLEDVERALKCQNFVTWVGLVDKTRGYEEVREVIHGIERNLVAYQRLLGDEEVGVFVKQHAWNLNLLLLT